MHWPTARGIIGTPYTEGNNMAAKVGANDGLTFGAKLAHSSKEKVDFSVSDDKKAFEIRFDTALAAGVGNPVFDGIEKTPAPMSTSVYSAVIPATGKAVKTSFAANGFGVTESGTNTMLILTVNDQHSVAHFTGKKDEALTVTLEYKAKTVTDIRLTVVLIAERDSAHPTASALVAVTDVSADAALKKRPKKRPAAKKTK
jgi:hypothetical protein